MPAGDSTGPFEQPPPTQRGRVARRFSRRAALAAGLTAISGVAAAALVSLNANDPNLVVPIAEQAMRNDDANVRREGVAAFNARPTPERVTAMARLLDDPHPTALRRSTAWMRDAKPATKA